MRTHFSFKYVDLGHSLLLDLGRLLLEELRKVLLGLVVDGAALVFQCTGPRRGAICEQRHFNFR